MPASETKNHRLRHVRELLDVLHEGVLEKILYDDGYIQKVSELDSGLEISGRYEALKTSFDTE